MLLSFNCFYLQFYLGGGNLLVLNITFLLLSTTSFSRSPDYEVNYSYLLNSDKNLLMKFHTIKILGVIIIKAIIITFYGLIL